MSNLYRYIKRLSKLRKKQLRQLPYFISKKAPIELKKVWYKTLFSSKKYLLYYIYSISIWKISQGFHLLLHRNKLKRKTFQQLLRLTIVDQIPSSYYYYYQLYLPENWKNRHQYLYHQSIHHLIHHVNKASTKDINLLNDKYLFYKFCKQNKYQTPEVFGLIKEQQIKLFVNLRNHPKNFIVKPIRGSKGRGFVRFVYDKNLNVYHTSKDDIIPENEITKYLKKLPINEYLIQELLTNHVKISPYCNDALATIRILSVILENKPILFRPIIQMPQGNNVLNYFHKGGLIYTVDVTTGVIEDLINTNKTTKAENLNIKIPYWEELKEHIVSIHKLLSNITLIGWDVAVTDDGYSILEGNLNPSLDIHQKPPYTPFIPSKFYKLIIETLK